MADRNEQTSLDYAAFLADLEAKKSALEQLIGSLKAVMSVGALVPNGAASFVPLGDLMRMGPSGGDIPTGAFLGKSIPEAAKLCLQIVKRKMTTREMADALLKGGVETISKKFPTILHSILTRAASQSNSDIVRLDKHWGLAAWYPAALRSGTPPPERRKPAKTRAKAKSKDKTKVESPKDMVVAQPQQPGAVQERIVQALRGKPEVSAQDIASSVGARIQTVHLVLGKLVIQKRVEKTASGNFRAMAA